MSFELPDLPYAYDALSPQIDARTMEIHHTKHHAGYTRKLNQAIETYDLDLLAIEQILATVSNFPDNLRNNAGGYFNHSLFWQILSPEGGQLPDKEVNQLPKALDRNFGTFEGFKKGFKQAALDQFGSGWAWLVVDEPVGDLYICSTPNQDNPLMDNNSFSGIPILGLDVWEHAYYLNYQNRRADYVDAFFELINWDAVEKRYQGARTQLALV